MSILNPSQDGNVHTYVTAKELKKITFRIISQNIQQKFGIQVAFILEIKPQNKRFLEKYDRCLRNFCVHVAPLLGWECAYVCHDYRTKKKGIQDKIQEYEASNWHTSDLHHGKEASKRTFFSKKQCLLGDLCINFQLLLGWECTYVCHDKRNENDDIQYKQSKY